MLCCRMTACLLITLVLLGCATTNDPRQGGLLGYNPPAYEKRAEERRQVVEALEQNRARLLQDSQELSQEHQDKSDTVEEQRRAVAALDADIEHLDTDLGRVEDDVKKYQGLTNTQKAKKRQVMQEIAKIKKQIHDLKKAAQVSQSGKQETIVKLRQDIDVQLQIVTKLTSANR